MAEPLHFDIDFIMDMVTKQKKFCDDCQAKLDILTLYMQDLTSMDWKAPAAQEFKAEFEEWSSKENKWLEDFLDLSSRVSHEMAEWSNTASSLAA